MALTTSIISGHISYDTPLYNSVEMNYINFKGTNNSHITCQTPFGQGNYGVRTKFLETFTPNPVQFFHLNNPAECDKLYTRKLCRRIKNLIKNKFKIICQESKQFLLGSLFHLLFEEFEVIPPINKVLILSPQVGDSSVLVSEKLKFLKIFYSMLKKIVGFQLLSFSLCRHFENIENNTCSCTRLYFLEDLLCLQNYSLSEIFLSFHCSSVHELLTLYFVLGKPWPNKIFNSLFSSDISLKWFERGNIYRFTSFLNIITSTSIHCEDLFMFCKEVVKLFSDGSKSLENSPATISKIKPLTDLIPAFYFYFINILRYQEEYMDAFHILIQTFSLCHSVRGFIRDVFTFFKISRAFFLDSIPCDYSVYFSEQTDNILGGNSSAENIPLSNLNGFDKLLQNKSNNNSSVSTGKEEVELIDGIQFISFEAEDDLQEFVSKEKESLQQMVCFQEEQLGKKSREGRIVPTKTNDITKIKGWRNKIFMTEFSKRLPTRPKLEETISFKEDSLESVEPIIDKTERSEEGPLEEYCSSEEVLQNRLFAKEFSDVIPSAWDICFNEEFSHILQQIESLYPELLEKDKFHQKIKSSLTEGSEMDGVFVCPLVDEFLEKYSKFEVSFDVPKLSSMTGMTFSWAEKDKKESIQNIVGNKCEMVLNREWTEHCFDFDFQQGSNEEEKFILIRGRPVYLDFGNSERGTDNSNSSNLDFKLSEQEETFEHANKSDVFPDSLSSKKSPLRKLAKHQFGNSLSNASVRRSCLSLLDACKSDDSEEVFVYSSLSRIQRFSLVLPCYGDDHSSCFGRDLKDIKPGMILSIGNKRPLPKEAVANLELLKKDPITIDECWANIAASAVQQTDRKTIKRILVPVVFKELIEMSKLSIEHISKEADVEMEVKEVVFDLLEYVARKEKLEQLEYSHDPDFSTNSADVVPLKKSKKSKVERELRRLINVSLVEESRQNSEYVSGDCGKEHCLKGCICSSLNGSYSVLHCGKEKCMFGCFCIDGIGLSKRDLSSHRVIKSGLAKEESLWHQTVICKSNGVIIQGDTGKSKREKKLPTRYRHNVLMGKEMNYLDLSPHSISNWRHFKNSANVSKQSDQVQKGQASKDQVKKEQLSKDQEQKEQLSKDQVQKGYLSRDQVQKGHLSKDQDQKEQLSKDQVQKGHLAKYQEQKEQLSKNQVQKGHLSKDRVQKGHPSKENKDSSKKADNKTHKLEVKTVDIKKSSARNSTESATSTPVKQVLKSGKKTPDTSGLSVDSLKVNKHPEKKPLRFPSVVGNMKESDTSFSNELTQSDWDEESLLEMEEIDIPPEEMLLTKDDHPLNMAFVWCAVHKDYFCNCLNKTFFLKNNILCRSKRYCKDISLLELSSALTNTFNFSVLHLYDRKEYCARSYGSAFDYCLRNKSPAFRAKRELEIKNCIFSNTNSLVKLNINNKGKNIPLGLSSVSYNPPQKTSIPLEDVIDMIDQESVSNKEDKSNDIYTVNQETNVRYENNSNSNTNDDVKENISKITSNSSPTVADINSALADVITDMEKENCHSDDELKAKKKYRIGPAHFESQGSSRSISTKPKNLRGFFKRSLLNTSQGDSSSKVCEKGATSILQPGGPSPSESPSGLTASKIINLVETPTANAEELPQYGLLCLTEGFGYLPVKCFNPYKLSVKDPIANNMYHSFKDVDSANVWLNKFFKSKILFEDRNFDLRWVIIKANLLKKLKIFDRSILKQNSKMVNKSGLLVDRDKYSCKNLQSSKRGASETALSTDLKENKKTIKRLLENEDSAESRHQPTKKQNLNISNSDSSDGVSRHVLPPQVSRKRPDIRSLRVESRKNDGLPTKKFRYDSP